MKVIVASRFGKADLGEAPWRTSLFDEAAVEAALRLTERKMSYVRTGEVVAVAFGRGDVAFHVRWVLGLGATRAIHVEDVDGDMMGAVTALSAIVESESPDIIIMSREEDVNVAAGKLSAKIVWHMSLDRGTLVVGGDAVDHKRTIVTMNDRAFQGRSVCDLGLAEPGYEWPPSLRFASLKGIREAPLKPMIVTSLRQLIGD